MSRHTPGPWKYHLGRGSKPRFHIQTTGGYQIASTVELKTRHTVKRVQEFEENASIEANAKLIAAAPELLKALEFIVTRAGGDLPAYMNPAIKQAKQAIAKAEGK